MQHCNIIHLIIVELQQYASANHIVVVLLFVVIGDVKKAKDAGYYTVQSMLMNNKKVICIPTKAPILQSLHAFVKLYLLQHCACILFSKNSTKCV